MELLLIIFSPTSSVIASQISNMSFVIFINVINIINITYIISHSNPIISIISIIISIGMCRLRPFQVKKMCTVAQSMNKGKVIISPPVIHNAENNPIEKAHITLVYQHLTKISCHPVRIMPKGTAAPRPQHQIPVAIVSSHRQHALNAMLHDAVNLIHGDMPCLPPQIQGRNRHHRGHKWLRQEIILYIPEHAHMRGDEHIVRLSRAVQLFVIIIHFGSFSTANGLVQGAFPAQALLLGIATFQKAAPWMIGIGKIHYQAIIQALCHRKAIRICQQHQRPMTCRDMLLCRLTDCLRLFRGNAQNLPIIIFRQTLPALLIFIEALLNYLHRLRSYPAQVIISSCPAHANALLSPSLSACQIH